MARMGHFPNWSLLLTSVTCEWVTPGLFAAGLLVGSHANDTLSPPGKSRAHHRLPKAQKWGGRFVFLSMHTVAASQRDQLSSSPQSIEK